MRSQVLGLSASNKLKVEQMSNILLFDNELYVETQLFFFFLRGLGAKYPRPVGFKRILDFAFSFDMGTKIDS